MQQGHKGMSFEIVTFLSSRLSKMRRSPSQKASLMISLFPTRTVIMITPRLLTTLTVSLETYDVFTRHGLCRRGRSSGLMSQLT